MIPLRLSWSANRVVEIKMPKFQRSTEIGYHQKHVVILGSDIAIGAVDEQGFD